MIWKMIALCAALFTGIFASALEPELLALGEQRSISVGSGIRFSVGNPEVLGVKNTQLTGGKNVLLVKAKAQGYSDLLMIDASGKENHIAFRVGSKKQGAVLRDVEGALAGAQGIQVFPQGDGWVVRGEAQNLADFNLVQAFGSSNPKVHGLATLGEQARKEGETKIQKILTSAGLTHFKVRGAGSMIYLEGIARSKSEKEIAERLAGEVFSSTKSFIQLPFEQKDLLKFKVQILELIRSKQSGTGFSWSEGIPGILQLHQTLLKGQISLEASLNLLAKSGFARILSQPEISVNTEGVAELKVGGEIPIPLRSKNFSGVQWKPYGLSLHLDIPGTATDLARTNITVEISTLDHANEMEGVPATKINRMQTVVDVSLGKTIFLSGLMQGSEAESIKSFPVLGDIPILGALFRSKDFQEQKSELVIALTANRVR